jgi:hypothetical protein
MDEQLIAVYHILNNKQYYSLNLSYASRLTNITEDGLRSLSHNLRFEQLTRDHINVFTCMGVEYIGLETRRIEYERDKLNGTNCVEDAIKAGWYRS